MNKIYNKKNNKLKNLNYKYKIFKMSSKLNKKALKDILNNYNKLNNHKNLE